MIKYNYTIERDEGDETKEYSPNPGIGLDLPNLVYIEGPNGCGKSTFLNLIALGFYGYVDNRNNRIHQSLKRKMNGLLSSKHQKIKFRIEITDEENSLKLISEKKSFDELKPIITENGQPLSPETFNKKYHLIYDIPNDPITRLNKLTEEIQVLQSQYELKVQNLFDTLRQTIEQVSNARDPNREKELKDQINDLQAGKKAFEEQLNEIEEKKNLLEKSVYYKYYHYYNAQYFVVEEKIGNLEKDKKKIKKEVESEDKESKAIGQELNLKTIRLQKSFNEAKEMLNSLMEKKDHFHLERWSKIDFFRVRGDLQFPTTFKEDIPLLKEKLNHILAEKDKDNSLSESRMVQDLINVLEGYKFLSLKIPGINKTVTEFIEDLNKIREEKESVITISKNIRHCLELLQNINAEVEEIENQYFPSLREAKKRQSKQAASGQESRLLHNEINQLKEDLERIFGKKKHFEELFFDVGKPTINEIQEIGKKELSDYQGYGEDQLEDEIDHLCEKLNKEKKKIESCEHEIKKKNHELEIHQSRKEHKYQHKLPELEDLREKTAFLLAKLKNDFNGYIVQIIDNKISESISEEQKKYNEAIFKYLAKRLETVRHITGVYNVKKVDLVKQEIITVEGKTIHFDDMGTGQSQSAYLTGLLHANDGRKIIALFDEVAMMTEESLEPIYQQFNELYKNRSLLLGIVVQKAKKVKVISKLD